MIEKALAKLEETMGYQFGDRRLLAQALTHSSRNSDVGHNNQRLEFLGDAILSKVITAHLFQRFPDCTEGVLTRVRSAVVSRAALGRVAKGLDLGRYLFVAKGVARAPHAGGRGASPPTESGEAKQVPVSLLSDAFEAITAAVYLDGGATAAEAFILRHMHDEIELARENAHAHNSKSALQQLAQAQLGVSPLYEVMSEEGPDHVKSFEVVARIGGRAYGRGRGATKKAAEQQAAERTLALLAGEGFQVDGDTGAR